MRVRLHAREAGQLQTVSTEKLAVGNAKVGLSAQVRPLSLIIHKDVKFINIGDCEFGGCDLLVMENAELLQSVDDERGRSEDWFTAVVIVAPVVLLGHRHEFKHGNTQLIRRKFHDLFNFLGLCERLELVWSGDLPSSLVESLNELIHDFAAGHFRNAAGVLIVEP